MRKLTVLKGFVLTKAVGIIGFGNQAKSWALNLRDSGFAVTIILRPNSRSLEKVKQLGLNSLSLDDMARSQFDLIAMLIPDDQHLSVNRSLAQQLEVANICYAHGHSLTYDNIATEYTQFNHLLLAPKAIGSEIRFQYETKGELGAFYSVEHSTTPAKSRLLLEEIAKGLGITKGPFACQVSEETRADLFSEQSILCSLIPYGARKCFDTLVEKGVPKELAYFETWYEMKLIVDTLVKKGPEEFFSMISPNALVGSQYANRELINSEFEKGLDRIYENLESGAFVDYLNNSSYKDIKESVVRDWKQSTLAKTHQQIFTKSN